MVSKALFSSRYHNWRTPRSFFKCLERLFGKFDLDPCTDDNHLQLPHYYTPVENGLKQKWFGRVYVNPPYRDTEKWVRKAVMEVKARRAEQVVMLVAARTDTKWFHELVLPYATTILFVKGRIRFEGALFTAPFPSMIVVFSHDKTKQVISCIGSLDPKTCKTTCFVEVERP